MKLGIFSPRKLGEPAAPDEWADRTLPKPEACVSLAAITVLDDGAKWIWEEQRKHLGGATGVLDLSHALKHVAATAQVMHSTPSGSDAWTATARTALLEQG